MYYGQNNPDNYNNIRQEIVNYLEKNESIWKNFVSDITPTNYLAKMRKDTEWGDQIEIMAFCNLYGCTIYVHQPNKPVHIQTSNKISDNNFDELYKTLFGDSRELENNTYHIYYNGVNHYQTLILN